MDMINMQNQAKEWLSRIKDKVRYYDIQASVISKKKSRKRNEHYPDIQELWSMFKGPNLIISREAEGTVIKN